MLRYLLYVATAWSAPDDKNTPGGNLRTIRGIYHYAHAKSPPYKILNPAQDPYMQANGAPAVRIMSEPNKIPHIRYVWIRFLMLRNGGIKKPR